MKTSEVLGNRKWHIWMSADGNFPDGTARREANTPRAFGWFSALANGAASL
jgi:hypothetical protein